jgi:hypothetical protein
MRLSAAQTANLAAAAILIGFAGVAVVLVTMLGPFGLVLLGLLTLLVCTRVSLSEDSPTWSPDAFAAKLRMGGSPEQRAARNEERRAALAPLSFYRRCGLVLIVAGAAGLAWQHWA